MTTKRAGYGEILVHVTPAGVAKGDAGLDQAFALAKAHGARVSAMIYDTEAAAAVTWSGIEVPVPTTLPPNDEAPVRAAAAAVEARGAKDGVAVEVITERSYAYGVGESFADVARVRDAAVLTLPALKEIGRRLVVEAALFHSGRPVILCPRGAKPADFARVIVAWDASRAAVRALNDAMPILARAKAVTVVSVNDDKTFRPGQSAIELTRHLTHNGVAAGFKDVKRGRRAVGAALADAAHEDGASLLVMGGYAHSRLRDLVLGSATRDVLTGKIDLPVLMST